MSASLRRFIILGATGDLASRHLVPALARLLELGRLPADLHVLGIGRQPWDTPTFRRRMTERLAAHGGLDRSARDAIVSRLEYRSADVADPARLADALGRTAGPFIAYLALPPAAFAPAVQALARLEAGAHGRVVVEKPFGEDLGSARALNRLLHETFPERAIFRMDHFLGKQTVQNILGLRFANRIFEPIWNRNHIARVDIVWDEALAIEGRAGYYDGTGALRDMVQNHLLQLLCLIAMEPPVGLDERDLRDGKVDVLRAVRRLTPDEVARDTRRARYGAGRLGDRTVRAYVEEEGVDPDRRTETFACVRLTIDNWRWAGIPFVLRTGKALGRECREIHVHFQPVPHLVFDPDGKPRSNVLRLRLDPDLMSLGVNVNDAGDLFKTRAVALETELAPPELPAYARLLLDVLDGDPTLSIRADEAEESWSIVEPILDAWAAGRAPLDEYPAGSSGPLDPAGP
jgi:glucose-6-phosphate 1-dehydrogenase